MGFFGRNFEKQKLAQSNSRPGSENFQQVLNLTTLLKIVKFISKTTCVLFGFYIQPCLVAFWTSFFKGESGKKSAKLLILITCLLKKIRQRFQRHPATWLVTLEKTKIIWNKNTSQAQFFQSNTSFLFLIKISPLPKY